MLRGRIAREAEECALEQREIIILPAMIADYLHLIIVTSERCAFTALCRGDAGDQGRDRQKFWRMCPSARLPDRLLSVYWGWGGDSIGIRISLRLRNQGVNGALYRAQTGSPATVNPFSCIHASSLALLLW